MELSFYEISRLEIPVVMPMIQKLTGNCFSDQSMKLRLEKMLEYDYECKAIYLEKKLIGVFGLWDVPNLTDSYQMDHYYIDEAYRGKSIEKEVLNQIKSYVRV